MHTVIIPFALLAARDARMSRQKYLLKARAYPRKSIDRVVDLDIAIMYRKHEKSWMETYLVDSL